MEPDFAELFLPEGMRTESGPWAEGEGKQEEGRNGHPRPRRRRVPLLLPKGMGTLRLAPSGGVQKQGRGAKGDQSEESIKKGDLVASQESSMQRSPN